MQTFRSVRAIIHKELAGPWHGSVQSSRFDGNLRDDVVKQPTSLIRRFVETYLPQLVGTEITTRVNPLIGGMRGPARLRELLLNHTAKEIHLARTHRLVVLDSLLCGFGLYKVGTCAGSSIVKVMGEQFNVGQFYADRVDPDDFARDPDSRDPNEDTWRAFRYRVPKQFLLDLGMYDSDLVESLPPCRSYSPMRGETTAASGNAHSGSELVEMVELCDILVYEGDKVLEMTIPVPGTSTGFLMEPREYEGPERGPLIEVRPRELPNSPYPISPAAQLLDLHDLEKALTTKAARRMLAQCRKAFYDPEEEEQALELANGMDDELIKGKFNGDQVDFGGIDSATIAGIHEVTTWANNETANLQQMSGNNDPNVKTATVGMMLQGNARLRVGDIKSIADEGLNRVIQCMAWDLDNDPYKQQRFSIRMRGGEMVDVMYDARAKKGGFGDFLYQAVSISEEPTDPRQKRAEFAQILDVVARALPVVAQLGGDVAAAVRVISDKYACPELDEIFPTPAGQELAMAEVMAAQGMTSPNPPTMRAVGRRGPSLPEPGAVRRPIDQRRADLAPTF